MKNNSLLDVVFAIFIYGLVAVLLFSFMVVVVKQLGEVVMVATANPTNFIAFVLTMGFMYWYKRQSINNFFAGFKQKMLK